MSMFVFFSSLSYFSFTNLRFHFRSDSISILVFAFIFVVFVVVVVVVVVLSVRYYSPKQAKLEGDLAMLIPYLALSAADLLCPLSA